MPSWPFWTLFLCVGVVAAVWAKRLDDEERHRARERRSSAPPSTDE